MAEDIVNDLNLLRLLLHSDDDLQIRPSGDFNQVCLKLNSDIQISFLINTSTTSLTIDNLHDLRIYQISNKNSLKREQWIHIQDYFNQLIQQSNSLYSIIQSIQDEVSKPISQSNEIKSISISNEDASTVIKKFRGADLIFNRIVHDSTIDRSKVLIGYEDRFTGIHEIPFNDFKKVHEDEVIEYLLVFINLYFFISLEFLCIVFDIIKSIKKSFGIEFKSMIF
jgi:hypothetical protein